MFKEAIKYQLFPLRLWEDLTFEKFIKTVIFSSQANTSVVILKKH